MIITNNSNIINLLIFSIKKRPQNEKKRPQNEKKRPPNEKKAAPNIFNTIFI